MTSAEVIALTVFNGCIATIGTLSNILVKLAVLLTRQLREICTAVLPISLSMTDVIICAVHQPMNIYDINYGSSAIQRPFDLDWDLVFSWRPWTASSLPPWTASSTSRIPYQYLDWTSTKYVIVSAFCAQWFIAILLTLLNFTSAQLYTGAAYIAGFLVLTVALHISMYCIASRQNRQINSQYPTASQKSVFRNKSTAVVTMTVVVTLLCWAPIVILPAVVPPSSPSFKRYINSFCPLTHWALSLIRSYSAGDWMTFARLLLLVCEDFADPFSVASNQTCHCQVAHAKGAAKPWMISFFLFGCHCMRECFQIKLFFVVLAVINCMRECFQIS